MKTRIITTFMIAVLLLTIPTLASANRPVTYDLPWVYGQPAAANFEGKGLSAFGSGPTCTPTRVTFLQWNLSNIAFDTPINYVKVSLTAGNVTGITASTQLGIYPASDAWTGASTNGTMQGLVPAKSTLLKAIPAPAQGGAIAFVGQGAGDALVDYVQNQVKAGGDRTVSFAVMFENGCDPNSDATYTFPDSTGYPAGIGAVPDLLVSSGPNAVDLTSVSANEAPVSWPLYAGLAAVALFVVAGVAISRRRTA